jgi:hypothetical protein
MRAAGGPAPCDPRLYGRRGFRESARHYLGVFPSGAKRTRWLAWAEQLMSERYLRRALTHAGRRRDLECIGLVHPHVDVDVLYKPLHLSKIPDRAGT